MMTFNDDIFGTFQVGDVVEVLWGGHFWGANILNSLPGNQYQIHYLGWASTWDETVPASRIRRPQGNAVDPMAMNPGPVNPAPGIRRPNVTFTHIPPRPKPADNPPSSPTINGKKIIIEDVPSGRKKRCLVPTICNFAQLSKLIKERLSINSEIFSIQVKIDSCLIEDDEDIRSLRDGEHLVINSDIINFKPLSPPLTENPALFTKSDFPFLS